MELFNFSDFANENVSLTKNKKSTMFELKTSSVIDFTKSEKPVYDIFDHPKHSDFTSEDHKDAADLNKTTAGKANNSVYARKCIDRVKMHDYFSGLNESKTKVYFNPIGKTESGKTVYDRLH